MRLTSLRLMGFRNYNKLFLEARPGLNVFVGENAAGKTNILESMFLCALGRSHRTRQDINLINHHMDNALISINLEKQTGSHKIECRLGKEKRKELKIDGMALTKSGELLGCLQVVMFSPEDLKLIKQGPGERRRFLDMELSQLKPAYYYNLQRYNAAIKHRNALLRRQSLNKDLVFSFDEQISQIGAEIILDRQSYVKKLSVIAIDLYRDIAKSKETLKIIYDPALPVRQKNMLAADLKKALADNLEKDVLRGGTSIGPHRDDVLLYLDDQDIRIFGSQGQQRTAALSLKLSELELMKTLTGEKPVLLLDDVLSELDNKRQRTLAKLLTSSQAFLTCTHLQGLMDIGIRDMCVYTVEKGKVTPQ